MIVADQFGTTRARVHRIGEECHALHARHAEVLQNVIFKARAIDGFGKRDPVVDVDLIDIQAEIELAADLAGEAYADIARLFRFQRGRTQAASQWVVDRKNTTGHQLAVCAVAAGGGLEADLAQRRRAEVVRYRATQCKAWYELPTAAELAAPVAAEIAVVLVACGCIDKDTVGDVAGCFRIQRLDLSCQVGRVLRLQAAACLCARGRVDDGADGVRGRVAGLGLETFMAEFTTQRQGKKAAADTEVATGVEVGARLVESIVGNMERGGTVRAQRCVQRIAQVIVERVATPVQAAVVTPVTPVSAHAAGDLGIAIVTYRLRQIAVRIDRRNIGAAVGITKIVVADRVALGIGTEAVQLGRLSQRQLAVEPAVVALALRIACDVVAATL